MLKQETVLPRIQPTSVHNVSSLVYARSRRHRLGQPFPTLWSRRQVGSPRPQNRRGQFSILDVFSLCVVIESKKKSMNSDETRPGENISNCKFCLSNYSRLLNNMIIYYNMILNTIKQTGDRGHVLRCVTGVT